MPSPTQLLIILVVVALIFGTKKLRNIGSDLGSAVKGFKKGVADDETQELNHSKTETPEASKTSEKEKSDS